MSFSKINLDSWERKPYYDFFMEEKNKMRCHVAMTAHVDITKLLSKIKEKNLRCYPTFTYLVSRIINSHDEFKTTIQNGVPCIWDKVHIRYPMFNEKEKNLTCIWLEYSSEFKEFYANALKDIEKYSGIKSMCAKENFPPNFYDITSIPWVSFTDFYIDMHGVADTWLTPFVAIGKFFNQNDKTLLPVHIKVHHAVCDGYHTGMFFKELQELCKNTYSWM